MPPKNYHLSRQKYLDKMKPFQLSKEWQKSIQTVWERNKDAENIDWRDEGILPPVQKHTRRVAPPILSLESIARRFFNQRALEAHTDVLEKNREDMLIKMGRTMPDCDIGVVNGLKHVLKCGIPLEKYWPFGKEEPLQPLRNLYKYMIDDYSVIHDAHEPTVKHMLKQFPLICVANLSNAVSKYKAGEIYTKKQNDRGKKMERHAMLLVGWGGKDGREYYIVMNNWGTEWGDKGFGFFEKKLIESVYYPIILPPKNMPPPDD